MTNAPDPNVPLDLTQLRAAQAENLPATVERKETLNIGRFTVPLVKHFSPLEMIELQEAQESGSLRAVVEAIPLLVPKAHREALTEYLLSDPDDEAERLDFNDVIEEFGNALEAITTRPKGK